VRLCVITDEISDDVTHALGVAESLELGAVELRILDGRNIVEHPPAVWRRVAASLAAGGFACPVVDSPFLKESPVPGDEDWRGVDWSTFDRAVEVAGVLGAGIVRVFSGRRRPEPTGAGPGVLGWLAETLAEADERARQGGRDIAVEIEHVCTVATAAEAVGLAELARGDWGWVLDPGNESYLTGRPAQADLVDTLAPGIRHVHVKDVDPRRSWIRVGDGVVDWTAQLTALRDSGYTGHLSMETHYRAEPAGLETATRESVTALRELAAAAGIELR
jgi:L-ribulose-5-phosphate 3-epimerase